MTTTKDIFSKYISLVPAHSRLTQRVAAENTGPQESCISESRGCSTEPLIVRLHLPGDTSPRKMARWEVEYQPSRKQEAGLKLPEASTVPAAGPHDAARKGEFRYTRHNRCESGPLSAVLDPTQVTAFQKQLFLNSWVYFLLLPAHF